MTTVRNALIAASVAVVLGICVWSCGARAEDGIPKVGEEVGFQFICKGAKIVEQQIDAIYAARNTEKANDMLKEAIASGDCALLPGVMVDTIKELGKVRGTYKNAKGQNTRITAVRVDDDVWTGYIDFADDDT